MLKLRATTTVDAVDTDLLLLAWTDLIRRWRALEFIRGVVIDRYGRRREGLRVERGTHPRAGTRYRILMYEPEPEAATATTPGDPAQGPAVGASARTIVERQVDVTADDPDRIALRVTEADGLVTDVELRRPARPDRLTTVSVVEVKSRWPFRGALTIETGLDLAALPPRRPGDGPQLLVDVRHRLLRASVGVRVEAVGDRWDVAVDATVAGRGIARPLFHPAVPFVRRTLRQAMVDAVEHLPADVASFNRELGRLTGPTSTPSDLAGIVLDLALAEVVDTVPAA